MKKFNINRFTNLSFITVLILLVIILNGCPHQIVKQLNQSFPDSLFERGKYRPAYLTNFNKFRDIAHYQHERSKSFELTDSIKRISKIRSELISIKSGNYPQEIELNVQVFDRDNNYIIGLAPPYYKGDRDYKDFWYMLTDS